MKGVCLTLLCQPPGGGWGLSVLQMTEFSSPKEKVCLSEQALSYYISQSALSFPNFALLRLHFQNLQVFSNLEVAILFEVVL